MRRPRGLALLLLALAAGACEHEFEPPDRAARVARADSLFATQAFDSLTWAEEEQRLTEGNLVYAEECRRCHGTLGMGTTDYARERDLDVPSLVERDWPMANVDSLRRKIFIGHESGMPIYGDGDLTLREIDATAGYILRMLRPEVLGEV